MRRLSTVFTIIICLLVSGCGQAKSETASFDSYMIDNELAYSLLSSDALFAYETDKTEANTRLTVYVWDNLLRRQLRLDLMRVCDGIPDKDKIITVENGSVIKIDNKEIGFECESDLSKAVLKAIMPKTADVNARTFRRELMDMIIRLETLESLGDTEVIALRTTTENGLLLGSGEIGTVRFVYALSDIPELGINS